MKILFFLFIIFIFSYSTIKPQSKFGLGIIVGEPTGISGKLYLSNTSSIDGAIGWSYYKYGSLHIHADYLSNIANLTNEVPFYLGIGGRIKIRNKEKQEDTKLAIRVPVGIVFEPSSVPIDVFVEVVPMLDLVPSSEFNFNAAVGIRYYFK
ncbi:MAG: BAPKO_0422 family outer member beta-barrel protein [Ignavibacteria bacterium]